MQTPALSGLCLFALTALSALGQESPIPQPPPRSVISMGSLGVGVAYGTYSYSSLLELPAVQKQLKISQAQLGRIKAVEEERDRWLERAMDEFRTGLKNQDPADTETRMRMIQASKDSHRSLMERGESLMGKALEPGQLARLREIQLQAEGPMAFTRPELIRKLNISPDQEAEIALIIAQGRDAMQAAAAVPPGTVDDPRTASSAQRRTEIVNSKAYKAALEKSREAALGSRRATMQAIGKVLSKKQRARYERMRGAPFEMFKLPKATAGE